MALTSVLIALRALAANRVRSFLTMLGIIIGVFAVVVLVSVGEGVENYVVNVFQMAGTNNLWVIPGAIDGEADTGELTLADARAIENPFNVAGVKAVAAENRASRIATRGGGKPAGGGGGGLARAPDHLELVCDGGQLHHRPGH